MAVFRHRGKVLGLYCVAAMATAATSSCTFLFDEKKVGASSDAAVVDASVTVDAGADAEIWMPGVDWVSDTNSLFPAHLVQDDGRTTLIGSFSEDLIGRDRTLDNDGNGNIGFLDIDLMDGWLTNPQEIGSIGTLSVVSVSKSSTGYSMTGIYTGTEDFCPLNTPACPDTPLSPFQNAFSARYGTARPDGEIGPQTVTVFGAEPVANSVAATSKTTANDSVRLSQRNLVIGALPRNVVVKSLLPPLKVGSIVATIDPTSAVDQLYVAELGNNGELINYVVPVAGADGLGTSVGWTLDEEPINSDLYAVATFDGGLALSVDTDISFLAASNTLLVAKLSRNLKEHRWISSFGSRVAGTPIFSHVLGDGSLLITGAYSGEFELSGENSLSSPNSSKNVFLLHVNADGTLRWASNIGGTGNLTPRGIVVDSQGVIYIAGSFTGGLGVSGIVSSGMNDGFVVKLDSNGNLLGGFRFGGAENDTVVGLHLANEDDVLVGVFSVPTGGPVPVKFDIAGVDYPPGRYIFKLKTSK